MRNRNRRPADAAESEPPVPEPQGDGAAGGEGGGEEVPPSPSGAAGDTAEAASTERENDGGSVAAGADQQLMEQRDRYLRLAAEYDNFRKRSARERAEAGSRAQAELVTRLIDAIDDLSRFAHIDPATTDSQTLHKGIEMVEQKMLKSLGAAGLEVIYPLDQTFDPTLHEAVATEAALSAEDDHTVAKVFQAGYRFNGQLLRPARVVVKQWNG